MKALIARYRLWQYRRAVHWTETRLELYKLAVEKYQRLVDTLEERKAP